MYLVLLIYNAAHIRKYVLSSMSYFGTISMVPLEPGAASKR